MSRRASLQPSGTCKDAETQTTNANLNINTTPERGTIWLLSGFICLGSIALKSHIRDFKNINDYYAKTNYNGLPLYVALNTSTWFAGSILFGKPYLPTTVSFFGLLITVFGGMRFPGLFEWADKLFGMLTALSVGVEYLVSFC
ncbi:unnamed protein product [Rotaria socialis]|uniref:Uncharacterized protein n=1 Tax=Rotaria socialis TaxID=392032 RepID=A0A820G766_9BILA|nr:unnamed protein product [Rotaria socialis]CAF3592908.1 unnamed protein product [Rotaria socialis]CAF4274918.1 unnamed protein product [Rotaria socialis]CAF4642166.1 unnamed protein product [Rotaria socialis]